MMWSLTYKAIKPLRDKDFQFFWMTHILKALSDNNFPVFPNCKLFSIDFHAFQSLVYQGLASFSDFLPYIYKPEKQNFRKTNHRG